MGRALTESGLGVEGHEITNFAAKVQIDLIIMSTHGRTEIAQAFLGVAECVVRYSPLTRLDR